MTQSERRQFLIRSLLAEEERFSSMEVPAGEEEQRQLLRALMNVRPPRPIGADYLRVQDEYLAQVREERGVVTLAEAKPVGEGLYLWQGDITRLTCDAIVNAANSGMTGCYRPLHNCIDNCIHTYAGVQLRLKCAELMEAQGHEEPAGQAKITPAYNLPSRYVIHTVGPIVEGSLTRKHRALLASSYRACLDIAAKNGCDSIAFCCISTGVFGFPKQEAAEIAVETVKNWLEGCQRGIKVLFNVFGNEDLSIYCDILNGSDRACGVPQSI